MEKNIPIQVYLPAICTDTTKVLKGFLPTSSSLLHNIYHQLDTYLRKVRKAPFISALRETQNYVRAAERGLGIFELPPYMVRKDLDQWDPIIRWLNSKRSQPVA